MVLEWLTDEDNRELADAIERVNSHMLDQLISSSDYLAVLFCKYCSTSLAINVDPTVNWPPIHPSIHPFIVLYPSSIHHPSFIHLLSILDPFLIHPSVLPPPLFSPSFLSSSPPPSWTRDGVRMFDCNLRVECCSFQFRATNQTETK